MMTRIMITNGELSGMWKEPMVPFPNACSCIHLLGTEEQT